MRIFSPSNEYTVISRLVDGGRLTALDHAGNLRLLLVINEPAVGRLLPVLHEWRQNGAFTEFIEFFPHKRGMIAVFAYHTDGSPLDEALADADYPLRAEVLRSLFAFILQQNLPDEILRGVLLPKNLFVSSSGKVRLMYDLPGGDGPSLSETVRRICGECEGPELVTFYKSLDGGAYSDYARMYEAAGQAAVLLADFTPSPRPESLTLSSVKERAVTVKSAIFERWALVLAACTLIAGYLAVGLMFYHTVINPPRVDNGIRAIGTVSCDGL